MLKFYPDHVPARLPRLLGDMLAALWTAIWVAAGLVVYKVVMALNIVADGITNSGRTFNGWIDALKSVTPRGIPGLSSFLLDQERALQRYTGDPLISNGSQAHDTIHTIALTMGLLTALPPILIVGGTYFFLRWRDAREMGSALAFVQAAERSGRLEQARAVLAYRAVATLSFTQLMKASQDPVGDLAAGRYERLATQMLKKAGLESFRLYRKGRPELETAPAADVGEPGQDEDDDRGRPDGEVRRLGSR